MLHQCNIWCTEGLAENPVAVRIYGLLFFDSSLEKKEFGGKCNILFRLSINKT